MTNRVRFAPSPTGFLHVGSARTALFNWLHARATGGTFVLRVEDTDESRNRGEVLDVLFRELEWLGIDWDEGPYYQSERRDLHRAAVEQLLAGGHAYLCDAENREVEGLALTGEHAVRFRVPDSGATTFVDLIRGEVTFPHADLEDFVIWRANGTPPFLLANAVDDADMAITHAIRGEDLLAGAPKVILLLEALGRPLPTYAHLPLLVNEARKKLSKRRDDVSLASYRDQGYLAEAMANYLALLGWGPKDDVEIRPMQEIIERFDLADVNKAAAFFDLKKLDHINGVYLRALPIDDLIVRSRRWLVDEAPWPAERYDESVVRAFMPLIQDKLKTLADSPRYLDFLFLADPDIDPDSWDKVMSTDVAEPILSDAVTALAEVDWTADSIKDAIAAIGERHDVKLGKAQAPIRVAVTGRTVGPPLFETMSGFFDRAEVLRRIEAARARLG